MRHLVAFLALLGLAGCPGTHTPPPAVAHVAVLNRPCLKAPPLPPMRFAVQGPPACPAGFAACLLKADAQALAFELQHLRDYASDAYKLCGPPAP